MPAMSGSAAHYDANASEIVENITMRAVDAARTRLKREDAVTSA
jgi:hypothetical protein